MFEIETGPGGEILLSGRLDATQVEKAREVLLALEESRTVDFANLEYIASAGLGVLLATQKMLGSKGCSIRLVNLNNHIKDVLHFSGFDQIFEIG
ncbi:MAG: STAS domain-containing protein [Thermoanaerobaculia bacterium]